MFTTALQGESLYICTDMEEIPSSAIFLYSIWNLNHKNNNSEQQWDLILCRTHGLSLSSLLLPAVVHFPQGHDKLRYKDFWFWNRKNAEEKSFRKNCAPETSAVPEAAQL